MNDFLYIYIHIPKSAGSTLRYHISNNYNHDEVLWVYADVYFFDLSKSEQNILGPHTDIDSILTSMNTEDKEKIKVILGHGAYFGIHKYFNKQFRYFTFFRNVEERQLSHYNFLVTQFKQGKDNGEELLNDKGEILNYDKWIDKMPYFNNYITNLIYTKYWREEKNKISTEELLLKVKTEISKYWFIGKLDDKNIDYIYYKLGISRFYKNQNISKKYLMMNNELRETIISKNDIDIALTDFAYQLNENFVKKNFLEFNLYTYITYLSRKLYYLIEKIKNILKPSRLH